MRQIIKLYFEIENIWFKLPEKLRYLLVGGFNTVFAYGVITLCSAPAPLSTPELAVALSAAVDGAR